MTLGALTTYTDVLAHPVLRAEFPLLAQAARRDRRRRDAEPRHDRRQHRQRVAGGRHAAGAAGLRRGARAASRVRGSRRVPYAASTPATRRWTSRPTSSSRASRFRAGGRGWRRVLPQGRHAPRAGDLEGLLCAAAALDGDVVRDVRIALGSVAPTVVRARTPRRRSAAGRSSDERGRRRARRRSHSDIAPIDDIRSTARYRLRVAENLLMEFLRETVRVARQA